MQEVAPCRELSFLGGHEAFAEGLVLGLEVFDDPSHLLGFILTPHFLVCFGHCGPFVRLPFSVETFLDPFAGQELYCLPARHIVFVAGVVVRHRLSATLEQFAALDEESFRDNLGPAVEELDFACASLLVEGHPCSACFVAGLRAFASRRSSGGALGHVVTPSRP